MTRSVNTMCIAAMLSFGVAAYGQTTGQTGAGATGQAGSQTGTDSRMAGDRSQTEEQVTLVGCIQREADYRKAHEQGRGGTMGTGMGVGNEFVLVNASPAGASQGASGHTSHTDTASGTSTGTTASGTAGTTGSATGTTTSGTPAQTASGQSTAAMGAGKAYALTGNRESELERYVGQRVEIVGKIDRDEAGGAASASGTASGTSGTATTGTGTSGTTTGTTSGTTASGTASGTTAAGASFDDLPEIDVVSFRSVGGSCPQ